MTELGIIVHLHPKINVFVDVSIIALQLSLESKVVFALETLIVENYIKSSPQIRLGKVATFSPIFRTPMAWLYRKNEASLE